MKIGKNSKIFIAGHKGLVGSAILRLFKKKGFKNIIIKTRKELDLINQQKVKKFFEKYKPDFVINAAAKVGGIKSNLLFKANFIYENLQIQNNLIYFSHLYKVKKLIFLASSCMYPKNSKQPMKEKYLLSGLLEPTNEPYAIVKLAGMKMCEAFNFQYNTDFVTLIPPNTYGPNDNYDLEQSHFFPAIIKKIYLARKKKLKEIVFWGNGKPMRELLYVDDIANACLFFLKKKTRHKVINIGNNKYKSIKFYSNFVKKIIYPNLRIKFDNNISLNGMDKKVMDSRISTNYGWKPSFDLKKGLIKTYSAFKKNLK